jgi:hypothetical protein
VQEQDLVAMLTAPGHGEPEASMKQSFRVRRADRDGGASRDDARIVQTVQIFEICEVGPGLATLVGIDGDVWMPAGPARVMQPHQHEEAQHKRGGSALGTAEPHHACSIDAKLIETDRN